MTAFMGNGQQLPMWKLMLVLFCSFFGLGNAYALAQPSSASAAGAVALPTALPETFYTFPSGQIIEKAFARSNGQILVSFSSNPDIYSVDPTKQQTATHIYKFPGYISSQGIAEVQPNVFIITLGNYTTAPVYSGQQGTYAIWKLDLTGSTPVGTKIIDIPEAINLDAIVTTNANEGLLIATDTTRGLLYRVDIKKPRVDIILTDPLFARVSQSTVGIESIGVDGIGISGSYLYFTNFARGLFGRVPFNFEYAVPSGRPSLVYNASNILDGFAFTNNGGVYIAESLEGVIFRSQSPQVPGSTLVSPLVGVNNVLFGRGSSDAGYLYGTFYNMATDGSGLAKIKVSRHGHHYGPWA